MGLGRSARESRIPALSRAEMRAGRRVGLLAAAVFAGTLMLPASAFATSAETYVSATGNDSNACNVVTTPCATFAGAVAQTSAGGEVDVLTSGSYGPVTITEPITIYASGVTAAVDFAGDAEGIFVDLSSSTPGPVVLHGLDIDGGGTGTDAVFYSVTAPDSAPGGVVIEDCELSWFTQIGVGDGDEGTTAASNAVTVDDSTIDGGTLGVRTFHSTSGPDQVVLHNDVIEGATSAGVFSRSAGGTLVADKTTIDGNAVGVMADPSVKSITLDGDEVDDNTGAGMEFFAGTPTQLVLDKDQVNDNGDDGILNAGGPVDASLDSDDIDDNTGYGASLQTASVSSSSLSGNTGDGLDLVTGSVSGSSLSGNGGDGLSLGTGSVSNSSLSGNTGDGLDADSGPVSVSDSSLSGNTADGVLADPSPVSLSSDTITQNALGLATSGAGSIVEYGAADSVFGNTVNGSPTSTVSDGAVGPAGTNGTNGAQGPAGPQGAAGPRAQPARSSS
jgi:Right handed beta helix region